jgi:thymidylate synthase (FAD)
MKIIEPSYKIIQCPEGEQCLAFLEECARTCYQSGDKIDTGRKPCAHCKGTGSTQHIIWDEVTDQIRGVDVTKCIACDGAGIVPITIVCSACEGTGYTYIPPQCDDIVPCSICSGKGNLVKVPSSHVLIRSCIDRGHESVIEHMVITVRFIVDRGITHELVRSRLCSFSQSSTRYCNYSKGKFGSEITVIKPPFWCEGSEAYERWHHACLTSEHVYMDLIKLGCKPEEARSVLPNSLMSEIVVSANMRQWRTVFKQRTTDKCHPQMLQIMRKLLVDLKSRIPIIFEDL